MAEKWQIIGVDNEVYQEKIGEAFLDHYSERIVATFDSEEAARSYVKKAKLKHPKRRSFGSTVTFRTDSLLRHYESAYIEPVIEEAPPPHNPEISK